jgi:hypothetical protein
MSLFVSVCTSPLNFRERHPYSPTLNRNTGSVSGQIEPFTIARRGAGEVESLYGEVESLYGHLWELESLGK